MIEKSLIVPAVQNFITIAQDLHPILTNGTLQNAENILSSFGQLVVARDTIYSILNQENNIQTDSDEKAEQKTQVLSQTQLNTLNNIMANINSLLLHITAHPSENILKELDDALQTHKELLLYWIGDVHSKNSMAKDILYTGNKDLDLLTSKVEKAIHDPANTAILYKNLGLRVNVAQRDSSETINTIVRIDIDGLKNMGLSDIYLNPFDREVHDVICTLYDRGYREISPGMIFRILSGNKKNGNIMNKEMRDMIVNSVRKMMGTIIKIDAKAEIEAGYITSEIKGVYEEAILPAKRYEFSINGQTVKDGILLLDGPPIYQYAKDKSQIARINSDILNTPLRNTPETIKLKGYLVRYIEALKNPNSHLNDCILYDTLCEYLQITAPNQNTLRVKKLQLRKKIKTLLDYWVQIKYILSYEEIEEKCNGNISSFRKVRLIVEKKKKKKTSALPASQSNQEPKK